MCVHTVRALLGHLSCKMYFKIFLYSLHFTSHRSLTVIGPDNMTFWYTLYCVLRHIFLFTITGVEVVDEVLYFRSSVCPIAALFVHVSPAYLGKMLVLVSVRFEYIFGCGYIPTECPNWTSFSSCCSAVCHYSRPELQRNKAERPQTFSGSVFIRQRLCRPEWDATLCCLLGSCCVLLLLLVSSRLGAK